MKTIVILLVVVLLLGGGAVAYMKYTQAAPVQYRTKPVKHGELVAAISATGTLEPEEVIDVGAQVAGQIMEFGKDTAGKQIDYLSTVDEGLVLAKIDDSTYQAAMDSAEAQRDQAIAGVIKAKADLKQMEAKQVQAQRDWERAETAHKGQGGIMSDADYDSFRAAYDAAVANVSLGKAAITVAEKQQVQAEAVLRTAKRNLEYCTIKSPVKGTIIDRRVNKGQTVVASLNAPSLFLIAKDLTRMQVWASVNEADVANIHSGQRVTFTVDALPGRTFEGSVNKVRLNASMTQNVVTYTVEIDAENKDLALLPYLTANVLFEVARKADTLLVENAALRWQPGSVEVVAPEARAQMAAKGGGGKRGPDGGGDPSAPAVPKKKTDREHKGTLWVQDGNYVKPIRVATGITDGLNTEIIVDDKTRDEIKDGVGVITGEARPEDAAGGDVSNPFAPKFGKRR